MRRSNHIVLAALLAVPGCSLLEGGNADGGAVARPGAGAIPAGVVVVQDIAFTPAEVSVAPGGEVTWTFNDNGLQHTVTADDASFDSGELATGDFKHTFDEAGTVAYHCTVHAGMKGTVVVG